MKIFHRGLFLFFLLLLIPLTLNAQKVGLLPFKSAGVYSSIATGVTDLLSGDLENYGMSVVSPAEMERVVGKELECYDKECAAEAGFKARLEKVIFGSITKLGEKYVIKASMVSVATRTITFSERVSAASAEDIEIAVSRLAKAIATGKRVEETAEIGKITEEEVYRGKRRKKAFLSTGLGFGMTFPFGGYADAGNLQTWEGRTWYETPRAAGELYYAYSFSSNFADPFDTTSTARVFETTLGISLLYFFSPGDISPYAGGGLYYKSLMIDSPTEALGYEMGIGFEGGGGIVVFRTYDFRLLLDVRYTIDLNDYGVYEGPHHGLKASVNILYKGFGGCCGMGGGCL